MKNERSRLLMEGSAVARLERTRLVREAGGDVPGAPRDRRVTGKSPGPLKFDAGINPRSGPRGPYIDDKVTSTLAERSNAAGDVWVAMETRGDFKFGDIVNLPLPTDIGGRAHLLVRDRGLAQLGGGLTLAIGLLGTTSEPVPPTATSGGTPTARDPDDLRTLPVRYDGRGVRGRSFHDAAQLLTESDQDWSVKGPRSMLWVAKNMADQGRTPRQRHYWWRQVLGLQADDTGVDDHLFLSEIMEEAACFDQINVSELMFRERIARRYQMWEQMYASALRKAEAGSSSGAWLGEREIFLGNERSRGHALICPELEKWVGAPGRGERCAQGAAQGQRRETIREWLHH